MAKWVECIAAGSEKSVYINLENVAYMTKRGERTLVVFKNGVEVTVLEDPDSILFGEDVKQGA